MGKEEKPRENRSLRKKPRENKSLTEKQKRGVDSLAEHTKVGKAIKARNDALKAVMDDM